MENLQFTRIRQLWKQQTVSLKRNLITTFTGLALACYLIHLYGIVCSFRIDVYEDLFTILFSVFTAFFLADTFNTMSTKEKRITFLSLPASASEKFIAYTSWHIIVSVLLIMSAYLTSEVPRMITVWLMNVQEKRYVFLLPALIKDMLSYITSYNYDLTIWLVSFYAVSVSTCILGSCLWYKRVFMKTMAATGSVIFIGLLLILTAVRIMEEAGMSHEIIHKVFFFNDPWKYGFKVLYIPAIIITIIEWYISYHLFCRREVISQRRRWWTLFNK